MPFDYHTRQERARGRLAALGVDALLLTPGADLFYLTGFEHGHAFRRLLALVLPAGGAGMWLVPRMNAQQVEPHLLPGQQLRAWRDEEGYLAALKEAVCGARTLAFDEEARAAFLMDLQSVSAARVVPSAEVMRPLRSCKEPAELEQLLAAAHAVDGAVPHALSLCRAGSTERAVEYELRGLLAQRAPHGGVAFSIVAGGPNSALPHHETGDRPLQHGDVVVLDFGTRTHGYHSDITVTAAVGAPADPEARRVYRVVWEAQQRALEAIRPGVPCSAVDAAARGHIERAGYGELFLHRTGHGLGLQLHEPPYLHAAAPEPLEEGMVFSVEPGIYLAGRFGVRLEVIVRVTADGVALLNTPRAPELPEVAP